MTEPISSSEAGIAASDAIPASLRGLRVLLVHDWLVTWGGAERCVAEMLALFPDADLAVAVRSPAVADLNEVTRRARETWLGRIPGARAHHRWFVALQAASFATLDTRGYDLVISSSSAFAKMVRRQHGAVHICYCYSPPRYLWDLKDSYQRAARGMQRLAFRSGVGLLRRLDYRSAQGVDHFVAISHYIADRIRRCYGRRADVVYPPVAPKALREAASPRGNFLLSLGRLVPYKRVDLAIRAAERLGVRLIVAGDGPERRHLEAIAGPHTEFLGAVSEEEAARLLATCAAFVFCAEEDFGIAPLEANAHGAPVVGFGRGGLVETMTQHVTAEFFAEQTTDAVVDAIERALGHGWDAGQLRANAARFSPEVFRSGLSRSVSNAVLGRARENGTRYLR